MKRFFSFVLAFTMLLGALSVHAYAADEKKPLNKDPFIFVHGLNGWGNDEGINGTVPYWGTTTGDLMTYLSDKGYECYACSVGPMNSTWDRACELYAALTGTTVDYGEAHAKEHNHNRYGRTYTEALVPEWGQQTDGGMKKIHLIGHSFGGMTVRMLAHLLQAGSEAEREMTPAESISPLFQGGKGDWVKSVNTVCAPLNSSSFFYPVYYLHIYEVVVFLSFLYATFAGRSDTLSQYVDFHLEQFGLTNTPGNHDAIPIGQALKWIFKNLPFRSTDYAHADLLPVNANKLNEMIDITPDTYYFSYTYCTTRPVPGTKLQIPRLKTNPVIALAALAMGIMPTFVDQTNNYAVDVNARANDGLVSLTSAQYPWDEPHTDFDAGNIQKGVWNVMPAREGDHGTAIGLLADADETRALYDEIAERLISLPD